MSLVRLCEQACPKPTRRSSHNGLPRRPRARRPRPRSRCCRSSSRPRTSAATSPHLVERLEAALPDRRDGGHLRRRQRRRHRGADRGARARTSERDVVAAAARRRSGASAASAARSSRACARRAAPWVCVMDADLQHPPELIAALLEQAESRDLDLVVASRYCERRRRRRASAGRGAMASRSTTTRARACCSRAGSRMCSDPMSGFFLVRRDALDVDALRPRGFKILLEILVRPRRCARPRCSFEFGERHAGQQQGLDPRGRCATSPCSRGLRFAALRRSVGALRPRGQHAAARGSHRRRRALLRRLGGDRHAGVHALELLLHRAWVFADRDHRRSAARRMAHVLPDEQRRARAARAAARAAHLGLGIHYVVSNVISLLALTLVRFALADTWIWAKAARRTSQTPAPYSYDIHGIVTVTSEVRLPELERFRVGEPGRASRTSGCRGWAGVSANGNGRRSGTAIRYSEGPGGLGFGARRSRRASRSRRPPRRCFRRSPHVLYTNVVEPILRWTFAERGYALVHAACLADGEDAFLITARTDTGKTTTSLKMLDSTPVLVPLRRPDARAPRRPGAHLPEAAHDQPAHAEGGEDAAALAAASASASSSRAGCTPARAGASR